MLCGSQPGYTAWKKKNPAKPCSLFIQCLIFCCLLVPSIISTTVCWDLLKMKGELEGADFN